MQLWILVTSGALLLLVIYLWLVNRSISIAPPEGLRLAQKPWTAQKVQDAYHEFQESPTDVTPYLFGKKNRRYIVVGGSGKFLFFLPLLVLCTTFLILCES